ncbi:c-type cytochrome [uncultured Thiocystis sp.]|uniref:c-type cytochrome n=1 Tax=uncultured Thiocystis sp. TaxID=1202134 RepID=UPI0025DBDDE3|nr:c-type cytochrome [uncultured Thiocystis sp.]
MSVATPTGEGEDPIMGRRQGIRRSLAGFGVLGMLALSASMTGCDRSPREHEGVFKAEVGRVPASPQRPGDPDKGYEALINRSVITCGLPYRVYRKHAGACPPVPGQQFPGRTGRNAELPYMLTAHVAQSGVELVTSNCLGCHAATFNGELVMGLGNEFLAMTIDPLRAVEELGGFMADGVEAAEWRRWAARVTVIADDMMTGTVGVNAARNPTLALMAHRDPRTLAWSDDLLIEPPPERPLPVSVPPWWNLGKKHALFYNAEGRGDHARQMMLAAILCTDSVEEAAVLDGWFVDVRAYLATLKSPKYPFPIDQGLAEQGGRIFQGKCKACHGLHGKDGRYPNRVIALGRIKTDPALARQGFGESDRFLKWFQNSFYGQGSQAAPALGYIAPPLDGVWATAPYLHNGSVPTLAALLDSRSRPTYWAFERAGDARPVYDQGQLGWAYRTLKQGKVGAMSWAERDQIYDTSLIGYGNQGHAFADGLSVAERAALLEYLKTL